MTKRANHTSFVTKSVVSPSGKRTIVKDIRPKPMFTDYEAMSVIELGLMSTVLKAANRKPSKELRKAMSAGSTGAGAELLGKAAANEIWQDAYLQATVAPLLYPVDMPADSWPAPMIGDVTFYKGTEGTAISSPDSPSTDEVTMTATEILADIPISYTLEEDGLAALMPSFRDALVNAASLKMDAFCINADATATATGNINLDDDTPAVTDYYLTEGEDGIRHLFLVDNTGQAVNAGGDALTDTDVQNAIDKMGKYAADPRNALIIIGTDTLNKALRKLDSFTPLGDLGPFAEVVRGQVGEYLGIPVVVSSAMPKTEADGKVSTTGGNNTLGQLAIVNRASWRVGFRRQLTIETKRNIQTRTVNLMVSFRMAIVCYGTRASATHTAGVYNILLS